MTNRDAWYHLKKYFIGSEKWDELSIVDKKAIEKGCLALRNENSGRLAEMDFGMTRYYTNGEVECKKDANTGMWYIIVDGNIVFEVVRANESSRGYRSEVAIYDNTVDKKVIDEIIAPTLIGDSILIHNAFDRDELREIYKEQEKLWKRDKE